jgi:hypothetical protein
MEAAMRRDGMRARLQLGSRPIPVCNTNSQPTDPGIGWLAGQRQEEAGLGTRNAAGPGPGPGLACSASPSYPEG